jgi:hypothetical protein
MDRSFGVGTSLYSANKCMRAKYYTKKSVLLLNGIHLDGTMVDFSLSSSSSSSSSSSFLSNLFH